MVDSVESLREKLTEKSSGFEHALGHENRPILDEEKTNLEEMARAYIRGESLDFQQLYSINVPQKFSYQPIRF